MIGDEKIEVVKRTPKRIHFSNGDIVSIKTLSNGMEYFTSRAITSHNKRYPIVEQMIRDIEGFLIYKLLTKNNERFYKIY
jgi:Mg2+/Co2+ transporter CorC